MKIVTFNIRLDCGSDGANNFEFRKPLIQQKLMEEQPDLICFQEVLPHVALWLKEVLPDYNVLGCGREKNLSGEQVTVAVKKDRFQIFSMQTLWLSETPMVSGSRYEQQSICPRTCAELVMQKTGSGELIHLINTHLDHEGSEARLLGMQQVLARFDAAGELLKQVGERPAHRILTGDFNAEPDTPEIRLMNTRLTDVTKELPGTFHDFGRQLPPQKIDYIAVSEEIQCESAVLWNDCRDGLYLSDHYPVAAEVRI